MEPNPLIFTRDDVPPSLQHLFEFAQRFGYPEYGETVQPDQVTGDELLRFWAAVDPEREEINRWHESLGPVTAWPKAAVAFLYMLQALDYAEPESKRQEEQRRKFWETTLYPNYVKNACRIANEEFRKKNYAGVVALLAPYAESLPPVFATKLEYAKKQGK